MQRKNVIEVISEEVEVFGNFKQDNATRSDFKDMIKSAITFIVGIGVFVLLSKI